MISEDEMELAIHQIAEYCRRYEGGNGDVILGLLEDLNEQISPLGREQASQGVRETFFHALSTLLSIADPPGILQFKVTLASLSELTDSAIDTIAFDPDPLSGDVGAKDWHSFEAGLPPRRALEDDEMATIKYFKRILSDEFAHHGGQGDSN